MNAKFDEHSLLNKSNNIVCCDVFDSIELQSIPVSMEQKRSIECHAYCSFANKADEINEQIYNYRNEKADQFAKLNNLNDEVRKAKITLDQIKKALKNVRTFTIDQLQNPVFKEELDYKNELITRSEQARQKYNDTKSRRDSLRNVLYSGLNDLHYQLDNLLAGCVIQGLTIAKLLNVPSYYTDREDWDRYIKFYIKDSYVYDEPVTAFHVLYGGFDDNGEPLSDGNEHGHISIDINTGKCLYDRDIGEKHGKDNFGTIRDISIRKIEHAIMTVMMNESWGDDNESVLESIQSRLQFLPPALRQLYDEGYRLKLETTADSQTAAV